ncbi:acyloxyacyl hydrolase [Aequorivita capsosiphonis]|uniref:acyloxyacyl hydrolase n=1 Tax=Aequorivita capsosiphonis TaxID=487317 RepID=UPI00040BF715|nr:acyloxyacyl hydrolase [Aequorivita capsosiphonis]
MKNKLTVLLLLLPIFIFGQSEFDWKKSAFTFTPEFLFGKTMEANEGFPETQFQKQLVFSFGRYHTNNPQQWAQQIKGPKTGFSIGVTDFGNLDSLGIAISASPFIEFKAFGSDRFKILTAMGASYFTRKFHPETNPQNIAVTTDITWAFRMYFYYQMFSTRNIDWRTGIGYSHHSNGHTRLLNQGYNSFLVSISADIRNPFKHSETLPTEPIPKYKRTINHYFAFRGGIGQNVFALAFNDKQNVYTIAGEYGRVYNITFKVGIGFYYRFYQHYYDYIKGNESLVQAGREFDYFRSNPWYYATNLGLSIHGEIFLNHVGIDLQLGYNLHKPAYKMDYRINEGWQDAPREISKGWVLGTIDSKFKKKYRLSSRLGLKYYLIGMEKAPKNNWYVGAHLNANLGQADFSELSLGYVHSFNFRERK